MSEPIRVLIVDDSAFVQRAVERMLSIDPAIHVVGTADNGADAVTQARALRPDVIVLDVNMPEVDGLEALRRIMEEAPTSVLMLSTLTSEGAETTLQALELGAIDFLDKSAPGSAMNIYELGTLLREKIFALAGACVPATSLLATEKTSTPEPGPPRYPVDLNVVVIGASTGGPRALVEIFSGLPADFPIGIVVAQHMPAGFTSMLAERLDGHSPLEVLEAHDLAEVRPGRVLIGPGGQQIRIARASSGLVVRVGEGGSDLLHRPSVDLLFHSAAEVVGHRAVGVILTGMGDDGALGLSALQRAGARTFAESRESAVIYGMPRAAAPAAERIVPLDAIGPALVELAWRPLPASPEDAPDV